MGSRTVVRVIDLPRAIVWDGLVDPVLIEGWFDPVLRLVDGPPEVEVLARRDPELLRVRVDGLGDLEFAAEEVAGGTRGRSTRLSVTSALVDVDDRLDRLEDLLRGHPTVWDAAPDVRSAAN